MEKHLTYLRTISDAAVSHEVARIAANVWCELSNLTGNAMPVPAACTGPDGQLMYVWDRGEHHLELEISGDDLAEFFYRDRITNEIWIEDYSPGNFSPELLNKIGYFKHQWEK